jgi:hypothetical protein
MDSLIYLSVTIYEKTATPSPYPGLMNPVEGSGAL